MNDATSATKSGVRLSRRGERAETRPRPKEGHVLLADRDGNAGRLAADLHAAGFGVAWLLNGNLGAAAGVSADAVVMQVPPDGRMDFGLLRAAADRAAGSPIVLVGDRSAMPFLEEAVNWGVDDFIYYPCPAEDLRLRLTTVLRRWRAKQEELGFATSACATEKWSGETLASMSDRLSTVVAYCALLGMRGDLPEDVTACLRHLSGAGVALQSFLREAMASAEARAAWKAAPDDGRGEPC